MKLKMSPTALAVRFALRGHTFERAIRAYGFFQRASQRRHRLRHA